MGGEHLVFGLHAVQAALDTDPSAINEIQVAGSRRDRRLQRLIDKATHHGVTLHRVSRQALDELVGGARHQGVIASCRSMPVYTENHLEVLLDVDTGGAAALLLVLDGVQDPRNLGACLRCADGAGAQALIVPRDRAVGLTPAARKTASGAAETVPLVRVTNLARVLRELRARGIWIVGATAAAHDSLFDTDLSGPIALVLGAEGRGLRRLTREQCDYLVHIPLQGRVESLNVSVAAGICLFEALRQRAVSGNA